MNEHSRVDSSSRRGSERKSSTPDVLVCFTHLRWDFVWQRPNHLMSRAAANYRVVIFEEPTVGETSAPRLDLSNRGDNLVVATPVLPARLGEVESILAQRRLLDELMNQLRPRRRVFWYYTPMALAFSAHVAPDLVVYDNMDELAAFKGAPAGLLRLEDELMRRADIVFTGGHSLYEAKRHRHRRIYPFPSSIDVAHFAAARAGAHDPDDQRALARPRAGFFGVIDERMDVELVGRLAAMKPDWEFVMIGPVVKIDPAALPRHRNIHWLGGRAYKDLPTYLAHWDVGFMPFAINEATRFISPTKTPEFLAAGLPVVSTPIADVVRPYGERGLVEIGADAADFAVRLDRLAARKTCALWRADVERQLATNSWDRTWMMMRRLVGHAIDANGLARSTRPPARPAANAVPA